MRRRRASALLLILLCCVYGCVTSVDAPVAERKPRQQPEPQVYSSAKPAEQIRLTHKVKKGDTLYSIAWRYGHDYKTLAAWNDIKQPYLIYPGQTLRLKSPPRRVSQSSPAVAARPKPVDKPQSRPPAATSSTAAALPPVRRRSRDGVLRWRWPAQGKLLTASLPTMRGGINIAGRPGQRVMAAADGEVVYSGSALRGYGKLIIIKHNDTYLSAYAYNRELLVREGQVVTGGQQIATMGRDGKGRPALHFEIRKNGRPVDPLKSLPRA